MTEIRNRVAESGILTVDLIEFKPTEDIVEIDLKDQLWQEMAIKEADYRDWIRNNDWSVYQDKIVAVTCSTDAIIPPWCHMLLTARLHGIASDVLFVDAEEALLEKWKRNIKELDVSLYRDARVVVKGCGEEHVPHQVYAAFTDSVMALCKSIMYGEPCSAVPVYKRPKG